MPAMATAFLPQQLIYSSLIGISLLLSSACQPKATRQEATHIAFQYASLKWHPKAVNCLHGPDSKGITVHTPDSQTPWYGRARASWTPNEPATGMPYQWGGFDTPASFLRKINKGYKAGDVGSTTKRSLGDNGTSSEACGIDCSGFVSRCWKLRRPYSTKQLPQICTRLKAWDQLKPGDIALNHQHVILFHRWEQRDELTFIGYDAGPTPVWSVHACGIPISVLNRDGYAPWRYSRMTD